MDIKLKSTALTSDCYRILDCVTIAIASSVLQDISDCTVNICTIPAGKLGLFI